MPFRCTRTGTGTRPAAKSLSDNSLIFSDCKALRRTTTRVRGSVCVRLGLDCLLKSETAVEVLAYDW